MPLEAARRELIEETGLAGQDWKLLGECEYSYPDANLHFYLFSNHCYSLAELSCPEPQIWVPINRLDDYRMPQANIEILNPMVVSKLAERNNPVTPHV